ncbi:uncharacterized protein LOC122372761 [Amphibalanus amphitrite]|uniref:uncharacterized protein LOC122372761 n=1 Tax=Amphibalanus amphitrite TaxID=1232801 RepID=UPI001C9219E6|nr:uncharacterized protein LOC122372761 [Amphibalanus amphitrite]
MDFSVQEMFAELQDFEQSLKMSELMGERTEDMSSLLPSPGYGTIDCDLLSAFKADPVEKARAQPTRPSPASVTPIGGSRAPASPVRRPSGDHRSSSSWSLSSLMHTAQLRSLKARVPPRVPRIRISRSGPTWSSTVVF